MNLRSKVSILCTFIVLAAGTGCAAEAGDPSVDQGGEPTGTMAPAGEPQPSDEAPGQAAQSENARDPNTTAQKPNHPNQAPAWNHSWDVPAPAPQPGGPIE
jgi:hypothetical protein